MIPIERNESVLQKHSVALFSCGITVSLKNNRVTQETRSVGLTLKKRIPPLKREYPWLREIYSQLLQSSVMNLSRAFVNFLEGRAQFPRLKAKHGKQSIQYPQHVKFEDNCLHFPKIGWVKAKIHRVFDGDLKTVTVSQTKRGHYYASLLFDDGKPEPQPSNEGKAVGIELGY